MAWVLSWEPRGVTKKYSGTVTALDLVAATEEVERDVRFDTLRFAINDFLDVEQLDVTEAGLKRVAAVDAAAALSNPNVRLAVVTHDPRVRALAELYAATPGALPVRCFETLVEARRWAVTVFESSPTPAPQRFAHAQR